MEQPNILLFLTDDHGSWALGCYGNREVASPVLDGLAAEGARFANAFTPCPVCSPARACLLTGRTPSQVGIHDWIQEIEPEFGNPDRLADEITLAEILHETGYYCGLSGKWHLGRSHETPRGYDWYFGLPRWQGRHIEEYTYVFNNQPITLTGNKTSFITDYALQFLDQAPDDRPFFLQVGYIATHSPYGNQEPDLVDLYKNATFSDIPPYYPHPWHINEGFPQGEQFEQSDCINRYAGYYAAVTDIDRNVGRILDHLQEQGKLENTLVIYTSDHGCALGHQGFWGKGNSTRPLNMYETSLRIPLLVRHPKDVQPEHVISHCIDHYDTFQTICEYAGADVSGPHYADRNYPGRSYHPMLQDNRITDWHETRYGEYGDLRMIRTPNWKLVRRYPAGPDDLFDLRDDPGETTNLAELPEYQAIRLQLLEELEAWYRQHEDPAKQGLRVKELRQHSRKSEAWRDGIRESRGMQIY